jgi:polyketide cyclase/dehydrase/lipid transport protein
MPAIRHADTIDVRAPAHVAFEVVAGDVTKAHDAPDSLTRQRPLDEGPLREGFRWRQTIVHERKECRSDWLVTAHEPGRVLEQAMSHFCAVSGREVRGRERWSFEPNDDGTTLVSLQVWRDRPGLGPWLQRLLGLGANTPANLDLRKRLAVVQFRAEQAAAQR